ncbi:MAG: DNA translocase FtsK 4TM domain-containing protein [Patescibacteria group bacterium]
MAIKPKKKEYLKRYRKEARHEGSIERGDDEASPSYLKPETKNGIAVVLVFMLAVLLFLSLFGWAGALGSGLDTAMRHLFGWVRYAVPVVLLVIGYLLARPNRYVLKTSNYIGLGILILSGAGFLHLIAVPFAEAMANLGSGEGGGYAGLVLYYPLYKLMGPWAAGVVLFALFIVALLVMFDVSLAKLYRSGTIIRRISRRLGDFWYRLKSNLDATQDNEEISGESQPDAPEAPTAGADAEFEVRSVVDEARPADGGDDTPAHGQLEILPKKKRVVRKIDIPVNLLETNNTRPTSGDIEAHKAKIQTTLENFGIEVEMGETKVGPTVTQYTLKPAEGVKLSQITTLANDLALALAAHPIRIEAPIPGKSLVGVEVPNEAVAVVKLKEVLESREYKKWTSKLTIGIGKDVAGHVWLADLDPMPHLLIAGATGSGKSVCLNSILLSLLYRNSPDELKLILVDPKRVELTIYNGIPHLLTPVITDIQKTINALRWVVAEMDRRFELLSKTGHRDIHAYNRDNGNEMPYLILAIDELADLMSVAANEVEGAIIRLAQMARAVGIHLILATQRPSVDIITGLIKANITSRIAFSVASLIDSRTILDMSGAEKLLGRGDMLYMSPQISKPKRLQGAYVTDQEITRVVEFLKDKGRPHYIDDVTEKVIDRTLQGNFEDIGDDELLEQARDLVIKAGKASASFLQRRLRIGYARAARLLDILEDQGIIGPGDGAKPRDILLPRGSSDAAPLEGGAEELDEDDDGEADDGEAKEEESSEDEDSVEDRER